MSKKVESFFLGFKIYLKLFIVSLLPGILIGLAVSINSIYTFLKSEISYVNGRGMMQIVYRGYLESLGKFDLNTQKIIFYILLSIFFLLFFVYLLKIINSNFNFKNFSFKKWWKEDGVFTSARIAEYFLISMLLIVLVGRYLFQISGNSAIVAGVILFFLLWHKDGVFGNLKLFNYHLRDKLSPWHFRKNLEIKKLIKVVIEAILFGLFLFLIQKFILFVLDYPNLLSNYLVNYKSWFSVFDHGQYQILAFSLLGFVLPFAYFIVNFKKGKTKYNLLPFLIIILFFSLIVWQKNITEMNALDLNKSVFKIYELQKSEVTEGRLYIFDDNEILKRDFKAKVNVKTIDLKRRSGGLGDPRIHIEEIPCNKVNDEKINSLYSYLKNKEFKSALVKAYLSYTGKDGTMLVYGCDLFNFNISQILKDKILILKSNSDKINLMTFLYKTGKLGKSLKYYLDESDIRDLELYLDSVNFTSREKAYLLYFYYHNGETLKAENIYRSLIEEENKSIKISENLIDLFDSGVVNGKFSGDFNAITKVVLLNKNSGDEEIEGIYTANIEEGVFLNGFTVKDATILKEDGSFEFNNLIEGEYYLGVLTLPRKEISFDKEFGRKIRIDKENKEFLFQSVTSISQ